MKKHENILVICAHNDDQIIGAGGTFAKYAKEGKKINTIIFSYGENSHPHLRREVIIKMRVKESHKSDKILGGSGVYYLGLKEGSFLQQKKLIKNKLKQLIDEKKPSKIFTHSIDDPHPDHRNVLKIVEELAGEKKIDCDIYSFDVWNPITLRRRDLPKLVVDVSDTFEQKVDAFKAHKSQKLSILSLMWNVYLKAIINGWNNKVKYAEVFYKIK